ncbi:MAG TPA: PAS domain S-box protein, partial [Ferruginibacter sp.]|nr:PAS domain S-box protein [Ferruginibacter sp.]
MPPDTLTSTQNLQQEKDRFEALFQYASMGIVVAGKGGDILLVNNFLITQFGYASASELVGQKIEKLIPSRYHGKHTHYRDNYNNNPHPRPMGIGKDLFAVKKDGTEFPVEVSLSNYTMDNESYTIGFINDISIRKGF